jgi:hypothetical protein
MKNIIIVFTLVLGASNNSMLFAQKDSLPEFTLKERNGIVFIGWNNPFRDITQLIIQRSNDSIGPFKSVISMPDPATVTNGFADKKEGADKMYYRIFYVLPGGRYTFTQSKRPLKQDIEQVTKMPANAIVRSDSVRETIIAMWNDLDTVERKQLIKMIGHEEKKTGLKLTPMNTIRTELLKESIALEPSAFIFTNDEGNLILLLPEAEKKRYSLNVFKEDGSNVFKMKNITERFLLLDKSNFYQSGWFKFELYDGNKLKDKNKFFIPPEGK